MNKNISLKPLNISEIDILLKNGFVRGTLLTDDKNIASAWLITQMNIISECISYCNQPLVMDIKPNPHFSRFSSAGDLRLLPHTDVAWHKNPPRFIGIFCLHPGDDNEYQTISDSLKIINSTPKIIVNWLRTNHIYFPSPKHINTKGFTGKVLDKNILRINSRDIRNNWSEKVEFFLQELINNEEAIICKPGDYWFFDNTRYAHGRSQISRHTKRHLLRAYGS